MRRVFAAPFLPFHLFPTRGELPRNFIFILPLSYAAFLVREGRGRVPFISPPPPLFRRLGQQLFPSAFNWPACSERHYFSSLPSHRQARRFCIPTPPPTLENTPFWFICPFFIWEDLRFRNIPALPLLPWLSPGASCEDGEPSSAPHIVSQCLPFWLVVCDSSLDSSIETPFISF